jgi:hypothetical protein
MVRTRLSALPPVADRMKAETDNIFSQPPRQNTLGERLARELADAAPQIARGPASYLSAAFSLDSFGEWLPVRLARNLASFVGGLLAHPIKSVSVSLAPDAVLTGYIHPRALHSATFVARAALTVEPVAKRRSLFRPILAVSGMFHSVLIIYLIYIAFLSVFSDLRVVNKAYRKFDVNQVLAPLQYPPQMLKMFAVQRAMELERVRELDRKRREELARERERAERERAERDKTEREKEEREIAEKEKAEKEKQAAEQAKTEKESDKPTQFGEINEAPIKDVVGKIYALYSGGGLDIDLTNFSVMAGFKIERDGSLSAIRIIKSSGNRFIDEKALEILWNLGESHALGPISNLTSNSIRLDLNETTARLTIVGFAPNPDDAKKKADLLNSLFSALRWLRAKSSPEVAELVSLIKVKNSGNRLVADLTVSRARASELMRAKFANNP